MQATDPTTRTDSKTTEAPSASLQASTNARRPLWLLFGVILGGLLLASVWLWRSGVDTGDVAPLPRVAEVPEFTLVERDGRTVTSADLNGYVWIADFVFTRCAGPCPTLSLRMRSLQKGISEYDGDVKLVSFSVDPEYDQPPVLRAYADRYTADPKLWWFLTCNDEPVMYDLVQKGFMQALSASSGGTPIIHTTRFVLVDRQGYIRAWYDGLEAASKPLILRDVGRLLAEPAG